MRDPLQPGEGGAGASLDSIVSEQTLSRTMAGEVVDRRACVYKVIKANGVLVMVITSDEEALEAWETIRHIEDRYNRGRYYPWVILSPQPLSDRTQTLLQRIPFASRLRTNNIDNEEEEEEEDRGTAAAIMFEFISRKQWKFPRWVEALKGRSEDFSRLKLGLNATLVAVRRRKRYMSGFLDLHDLLNGYEIFWRINPGLVVFCDLEDGPMLAMKHSGQKFGEFVSACSYTVQNSIGSIESFRSPGYTDYFNVIDKEGPIYYECWEDDTVITIGLSLLLPRNDIRFLKELGWGYSNGGTGSGTGIGVVPPKGSAASAAASAALTTETATTQVLYCPRNPDQNKVCHLEDATVSSELYVVLDGTYDES
ncbi:hypothetical protein BGZ47_009427 [Haplosporangium gracile]|nr:hypothetical protein BGZ47_009427 [Haplosporangium gracile]